MGYSLPYFDSKRLIEILPMTRYEPQTSGIGSNRSTIWATTTAPGPQPLPQTSH